MTGLSIAVWALVLVAPKETPVPSFCRISVTSYQDGDSFGGDLLLPFGITIRDQKFRIRDFDAWESSRIRQTVGEITEAELAKGRKAADALRSLLTGADNVYVTGDFKAVHSYNRLEVEVWVDPRGPESKLERVSDRMRALGHDRRGNP